MMTDSWETKKDKSKKNITLYFFICLIIIFGVIIFYNNIDFITQSKSDNNENRKIDNQASKNESDTVNPGFSPERELKDTQSLSPIPSKIHTKSEPVSKDESSKDSLLYVRLPDVKCSLADKEELIILVSLKLLFYGEKLQKEILFKRDDLTIIVKKILSKRELENIIVNHLRTDFKNEMNVLLKNGRIHDIEFLDFRPLNIK